jgi:hypothetical protein
MFAFYISDDLMIRAFLYFLAGVGIPILLAALSNKQPEK